MNEQRVYLALDAIVLECQNVQCAMTFLLFAVLQDDEGRSMAVRQARAIFCPYCGTIFEKPEQPLMRGVDGAGKDNLRPYWQGEWRREIPWLMKGVVHE